MKTGLPLLLVLVVLVAAVRTSVSADQCCEEVTPPRAGQEDLECGFKAECNMQGNCCPDKENVAMVRQSYTCDVNCLLIKQIHHEMSASFLYQAYASYFQRADVSLPGIQKFFAQASHEERGHADYLIDYVNKRGGHVQLDQLEVDRADWMEGLMALEDALAVERFVNRKLLDLHKRADDLGDAHLAHILEHDFLQEQVKAIYDLGQYVTRLRKFAPKNIRNVRTSSYRLAEYMFDQNLLKSLDKQGST
ncbi:hypothetical protein EGW08_008276 [Elysia chlorotica]|uniref:Ferritin n=1 Tax=Elysia chlorotica TaxID=188477 RepID=A0A433TR27_ELYCH|nr:hypothetical protein EGW08_008276 [Elysia chlorotica]